MKKTVSFFNGCKKYQEKILSSIKNTIGFVSAWFVLCIALVAILNKPENIDKVLYLGTNIRESLLIKEYTIADVIKVYPVFNGDNYIVAKEEIKEQVNKEDNKDIFDVASVDAVSNIIAIDKENYTRKSTKNYDRIDIYGVTIYDYSSKKIDYQELFKNEVTLTKKSDPVLLYCSHTSETYKNSENFKFDYTGNYRVKDGTYNMLSVAEVISSTLNDRGFTTVFDTTPHDYTSYDNAYKNSMKTLNNNLNKYSRFGVVIDVHRDAASDLNFGPEITVNGKKTAKLMLVVGVGYEGFPNEYWEENLTLALKIAKVGEEMYPGLFRHVLVRDARYNQHLSSGSLLVEVGATGNTLEEAYYGARCFANILSKIYK